MVCEVETLEPTRFLLQSTTTNLKCQSGVTVAADVSRTSALGRKGSNPFSGTSLTQRNNAG